MVMVAEMLQKYIFLLYQIFLIQSIVIVLTMFKEINLYLINMDLCSSYFYYYYSESIFTFNQNIFC